MEVDVGLISDLSEASYCRTTSQLNFIHFLPHDGRGI